MNLKSLLMLAAAVLGLLAVGLLVSGIIIAGNGPGCGSSADPCDGGGAFLAADAAYSAVKTLAFGAGISCALGSLLLLAYAGSEPNAAASDG